VLALTLALALQTAPSAQPHERPLAVFRIDPLGLDPETVARLEALLRAELERIVGSGLPTPREVAKLVDADARLANCTGEPECLAAIGRGLHAQQIVVGNVGGLADSYVINMKIVDVHAVKELRRVSEPLHGDPDLLIEEIRVAAYRLVAPEKVRGALAILTDARGARIFLDGTPVGVTPVVGPITGLPVGDHSLRIARDGYADFLRPITIRFQKTTQVMVNMEELPGADAAALRARDDHPEPVHYYGRWWFYALVGAAAIGLGVGIGIWASSPNQVQCGVQGCGH
jgi:hypothetical protein